MEDAINAGIERFGTADREAVRRAMRDLRLEPALAREVLSTTARKAFQARPLCAPGRQPTSLCPALIDSPPFFF